VITIYKTNRPEFTDEFVRERFGVESLQALRHQIKENLKAEAEQAAQKQLREKIFEALMAANPVELPRNFVLKQKERMIDDLAERFQREKLSEKEFSDYIQKWETEIERNAMERVHLGFLIDAIAKKFNLYATTAEVEQYIHNLIEQHRDRDPKMAERLRDREFAEEVYFRITENKVFEYLKAH
jgi:trigger factor